MDVSDSCFHGSSSSSKLSWRTKNWLFADTPAGARASANLYSLIETAKANRLEPWRYLNHLFEVLPRVERPDELEPLLPRNIDPEAIRPR